MKISPEYINRAAHVLTIVTALAFFIMWFSNGNAVSPLTVAVICAFAIAGSIVSRLSFWRTLPLVIVLLTSLVIHFIF